MESGGGGECFPHERPRRREFTIKFGRRLFAAGFRRVNRGGAVVFLCRQSNPDIKAERFAEGLPPILRDSFSSDPPDALIDEKSEGAGVITVRRSWPPKRFLFFQ